MKKEKILLIEDEAGVRELIQLFLESKNYTVIPAVNGEMGVKLASKEKPELILLDIEMHGIDGFDTCKKLRELTNVPIIFISSRRDVMDKVKCFDLGGDDYITKPFDFVELEARMRAQLRRYEPGRNLLAPNILRFDDLEINLDTYECFRDNEKIKLSTKEIQLLMLLAKRSNQVFSADQIYDHIWGIDSMGDVQTVKVHVRNLRRKLELDPNNPEYIITVRGFGYRFVN